MYVYKAHVVTVYDGDSFRADVDLGFRVTLHAIAFRLLGLNTPEMGQPGSVEARDYVRKLILDKDVTIESQIDKQEKYGRWLATVTVVAENGVTVNLNKILLELGLAVPYMT
jgi:endonuclease YncB( thermonuclease family)